MVAADAHPRYPPQQEIILVHSSSPHSRTSAPTPSPVSRHGLRASGASEPYLMKQGGGPKQASGTMAGSQTPQGVWAEKGQTWQSAKASEQPSAREEIDRVSMAPTAAEVSNVSSRWNSAGDAPPGELSGHLRRTVSGEKRDHGSVEGKKKRGLSLLQRLRQKCEDCRGREDCAAGADQKRTQPMRGDAGTHGISSRVVGRPSDVLPEHGAEESREHAADRRGDETKKADADGEFAPEVLEAMQRNRNNEKMIVGVFCLMFALEIFVNFDSGVVPAILLTLQEQFHLDGAAAGLLGSLPYIGLVASSPFVGRGLTTFSPKWFCLITMMVNLVATGLLGLAFNKLMLYLSRLLIGLSQSGFSIYAPVWVDQFAPADKLTLWMGLSQGGVVIGTMLGCVIAGSFDTAAREGVETISWRYALLIQAIALFILLCIWMFFPRRFVDITMTKSTGEAGVSIEDATKADAAADATLLEEEGEDLDELERNYGAAVTVASGSNGENSERMRSGGMRPLGDAETLDTSSIVVRRDGSGPGRESEENGPYDVKVADSRVPLPCVGEREKIDTSPRGRRLSLGLVQRPAPGATGRIGAGDEEVGRVEGTASAAVQGANALRSSRSSRRIRSSETSSVEGLPQFRKDILSNLLPLDFIATSPTFTRRASQVNPGPAPGSVNAARLSVSMAATAGDSGVPRPVGDVPVMLFDASETQQLPSAAEGPGRAGLDGRELTTLSRLGPPPSSSPEAALAAASALEEGRDLLPGDGGGLWAHGRSAGPADVPVLHPYQSRGGQRASASVPDIGSGRGRSPSTARLGQGGSASLANINARHSIPGGVAVRVGSISGPGEAAPGLLNRVGSTVSEVQYQMTFLTPHSTTLAFEAFNWAAGTADPLLLVRTDARQPTHGDLTAVEMRGGAATSHRRRSNASSSVSESVHATQVPQGVASPRHRSGMGRVSGEENPVDAVGQASASQLSDGQTISEEESEARTEGQVIALAEFVEGGKRRGRGESEAENRTALEKEDGHGHPVEFDWRPPRRSTCSTTGGPRLMTLSRGSAEWDSEPHVEAFSAMPRTFGVWQSICILFESPIYVCVTIALCALFFEVTAIQFWSITYFQQELHVPGAQVLVAFNATAATAPIVGVLAGGWFIDYLGGYKSEKGMLRTLLILGFWAVLCLFFGICASWVPNFIAIICFIWCILFFGGGILPAATGIVIASVPVEVRAFGSGFCMMIYNVFGYVLGTLVPGAIIQAAGLTWGMRVVFLWSIFGVCGLFAAAFVCWRLRIKPAYISYREKSSIKNEIEVGGVHEEE
ncbi:transporter, major facilitator family protein [Toxoplasma gondii ME49]|uniref:Transporter, major facilitator family protein n=2 Tax=Toxoplasma gondii TaxID=5811 RepID=S8GIV8_TOXGM|nr:transporter, major facilitator family protein [Toxoplasma gondii ME49]EPT31790.1 transporter, major facilitator family protein [Toxoplasma gondii ME49]KYF41870.1 transporter, major facilitator family protein [Toxoplasma gondii ARI]|eukprot:XP_018638173.1 transporter, major facilitator family protein [Toxoplasma gondii ME49]